MSEVYRNHHVRLRVHSVNTHGTVAQIDLRDEDGWELPPFSAGAHIDLLTDSGVRQYSLLSDPLERNRYEIGVLLEPEGRGGSRWVHRLRARDEVLASLPRNHFALDVSFPRHVLIAGGIGVTPLLSMARTLASLDRPFEVHYFVRDASRAVFVDDFLALIKPENMHVHVHPSPGKEDVLAFALARAGEDAAIYCCGPGAMLDEVERRTSNWDPTRVRMERFKGTPVAAATSPLTVILARSGGAVPVPAGQSILQSLRLNGVEVPASCEAGVCGTCRVRHLEGEVVHRDLILSAETRKREMLICVSTCTSPRLVLDL